MDAGTRQNGLLPEVNRVMDGIDPEEGAHKILGDETDPYRRLTLTYLLLYLPGPVRGGRQDLNGTFT